jgi:hypothetical protein
LPDIAPVSAPLHIGSCLRRYLTRDAIPSIGAHHTTARGKPARTEGGGVLELALGKTTERNPDGTLLTDDFPSWTIEHQIERIDAVAQLERQLERTTRADVGEPA